MNIQENISLKELTTFKIGGPAKHFCQVKSVEELKEALLWANQQNLPFFILGGGSNLLISDEGFAGLVIKNEIDHINLQGEILKVGSGTSLTNLINFTAKQGLVGLQKLIGIYGTVGGAVFGNAGAYGQAISDNLTAVVCLQGEEILTLSREQCQFSYRSSIFKKNKNIILEAHFQLPKGETSILQTEIQEIIIQRKAKFPSSLQCPGSFFKNIPVVSMSAEKLKLIPEDKIIFGKIPAAVLLELVGAKEKQVGNIKIAPFHSNLIINTGSGKAKDVWQLAHDLKLAVKEKFGIDLESEVQFINLSPL